MSRAKNFQISLVFATAPALADTEFAVAHGLTGSAGQNIMPRGYIVARRNLAASAYESGTAWTTTTAYLKSNVSAATFLFLFFV